MYYKQLPCIYHPNLMITNFCQHRTQFLSIISEQCLMPLCPSCIRQHTDYHQDINTKPSYFNIYQALAETDTLITNYIANLEKDKKRNSELIFKVNRLPALVREKIQQAKTLALKIVQQSFAELERDTIQTISKVNQQLHMHSLVKSQQLQQTIVANLQDLYDLVQGLKTESCLSDMIFFLKQKRFQVEDLHTEMTHYLYSNENHEPYIEISKEAQHSLAVVIHRMFKVDPKEKVAQRGNNRGEAKGLHENSYHISLTPAKIKKEMLTLETDKTIAHRSSKYPTKDLPIPNSSRHKNTSYQNYTEYQQHISRSRQASKDKGLKTGDQLKQISIRDKQKRVYPMHEDSAGKRNLQASTRRGQMATTMGRYPGYGRF